MALEMEKRTIDGHVYEFSQFGAKESVRILTRLGKIVGQPAALLFSAGQRKEEMLGGGLKPDILSAAVQAFTSRLDETEVLDLLETLTAKENVLCDGRKVNFNSHYERKLGHMFKVFSAALEVQFGNFFEEFLGKLGPSNPPDTTQAPLT